MIKITIAVPVYNSATFIEKALESFVNQTMEKSEFEVLMVDDCSNDSSVAVIKTYSDKLNLRVISLEKNSGGPGAPRNKAIELAEGEYIFFVDSDDYISKNALKAMYEFATENNSDVLLAKMKGVNGRGVPESMFKATDGNVDLYNSRLAYALGPTKMFKTSFLRKNSIFFPENLKTAEDQLFTMECFVKANVISVLAKESYYYATFREGEHMNSAYVEPKDFYTVMSGIMKLITSADEVKERKNNLAADFLNRHFNFSRTTNFTLKNYTDEVKVEWMKHLHEFVLNYIPEEVFVLTNPDVNVRLVLARNNDYINYANFEKEFKEKNFSVSIQENKVIANFNSTQDYPALQNLDITILNKLAHKLTNVEFLNESLLISCTVGHSLLSSALNKNQQVSAVFIHREKKFEKVYEVFLKQPQEGRYTFQIPFASLLLNDGEIGTWDMFITSTIESYSLTGRIGNKRDPYNYKAETSFIGKTSKFHYRLTPYFTKPFDNFSIYTRKLTSFEKEVKLNFDRSKNLLNFKYEGMHILFPEDSIIKFVSKNDNYFSKDFIPVWTDEGTFMQIDISFMNNKKLFNKVSFDEISINNLPLNFNA